MPVLVSSFAAQAIALVESSKYVLIFVSTFFEGPIITMGVGFLYHLGRVAFWPAYLAVVAGDFAADLVWYWVGYFAARRLIWRFGHWIGVTPASIEKVEVLFKKHDTKVLTVSKLTFGFGTGTATLLAAGMMRIPFKRYIMVNLIAGFVWSLFLFVLGYFFGNLYALIPESFRIAFALCALIAVFFGLRALSRHIAQVVD